MYVVLTTLYSDNPSISGLAGHRAGDPLAGGRRGRRDRSTRRRSLLGVRSSSRPRARVDGGSRTSWRGASSDDAVERRRAARAEPAARRGSAARPRPRRRRGGGLGDDACAAWPRRDRRPRRAPRPALAAAPSPSRCRPGRRAPTFDELGLVGWFRARLRETADPARPQSRALRPRARRPARPARPVDPRRARRRRRMALRTFRLAEPYQMHFDEVYHARTATEFLQDWRYGISHDIYEWTHPHLAKYAMAVGLVPVGEDDVSATSELGVPVARRVVEPRRDRRRPRRAARPASGSTSRPGTEIRTYDLATRELDRDRSRPPGRGALAIDDDGQPARRRLRRRPHRDARPRPSIGVGGCARPRARRVLAHGGPPGRPPVRDRRRRDVVAGLERPADVRRPRDGHASPARSTCRGSPTSRRAAAARRSWPTVDRGRRSDGGRLEPRRASSAATRPTTRRGSTPRRPARPSSSATPGAATTRDSARHGHRRRHAAGRRGRRRAAHRGRRLATASRSSTRRAASVVDTIALDGGAHGLGARDRHRRPRSCTRRPATPRTPTYDVIAVGGDAAKNGPVDQGTQPRCPAPGHVGRLRRREPDGPHPRSRARTRRDGTAPWTVYVVEPHGNAGLRRRRACPTASTPAAWAVDVKPDYPSDGPPAAPRCSTRDGAAGVDRHRLARLRLAAARASSPGALTAAAPVPARPDPLPAPLGRRSSVGLVRAGRRDVLRPVADRHERRLRRAASSSPPTRSSPRSGPGWWRGRAAFWVGDAAHRRLARASRSPASGSPPTRSAGSLLLILVRSALGRRRWPSSG